MYRSIEEVCDLFMYYLCKHLCRLTNQREFVRRINEKTDVNRDVLILIGDDLSMTRLLLSF